MTVHDPLDSNGGKRTNEDIKVHNAVMQPGSQRQEEVDCIVLHHGLVQQMDAPMRRCMSMPGPFDERQAKALAAASKALSIDAKIIKFSWISELDDFLAPCNALAHCIMFRGVPPFPREWIDHWPSCNRFSVIDIEVNVNGTWTRREAKFNEGEFKYKLNGHMYVVDFEDQPPRARRRGKKLPNTKTYELRFRGGRSDSLPTVAFPTQVRNSITGKEHSSDPSLDGGSSMMNVKRGSVDASSSSAHRIAARQESGADADHNRRMAAAARPTSTWQQFSDKTWDNGQWTIPNYHNVCLHGAEARPSQVLDWLQLEGIGFDIGGVLANDGNLVDEVFQVLKELLIALGPSKVWIVSKVSSPDVDKAPTGGWRNCQRAIEQLRKSLAVDWFHGGMSLPDAWFDMREDIDASYPGKRSAKGHIVFVEKRSLKGPWASKLNLDCFIDDQIECLESMHEDRRAQGAPSSSSASMKCSSEIKALVHIATTPETRKQGNGAIEKSKLIKVNQYVKLRDVFPGLAERAMVR